jgi:hypothetical protein
VEQHDAGRGGIAAFDIMKAHSVVYSLDERAGGYFESQNNRDLMASFPLPPTSVQGPHALYSRLQFVRRMPKQFLEFEGDEFSLVYAFEPSSF